MRRPFVRVLTSLGEEDERILLLSGDLGYRVLDPFRERLPDRFINAGVAEQNMVGMAGGLAHAGFVPFVYSIAPFAVLRPYEFIRNVIVHHQWPVRIVGVGDGFDYQVDGPTHFGIDTVAAMRQLPGLTVIAPADAAQAATALTRTAGLPGPIYYHLGTEENALVPGLDGRFDLGRAQMVRAGSDVALVASGPLAVEAVGAAGLLEADGVSCSVHVVASLAPPPVDDLTAALSGTPLALTVESNYTTGALGSLVCEVVAEGGLACRVVRCGVDRPLPRDVGSRAYLRARHGLTAEAVAERVRQERREEDRRQKTEDRMAESA